MVLFIRAVIYVEYLHLKEVLLSSRNIVICFSNVHEKISNISSTYVLTEILLSLSSNLREHY